MTDVDDILSELSDYLDCEMRKAGDVDARQIAESKQPPLSQRQGLNRLLKVARERADFEAVKVYDPDCRARLWVLRKVVT